MTPASSNLLPDGSTFPPVTPDPPPPPGYVDPIPELEAAVDPGRTASQDDDAEDGPDDADGGPDDSPPEGDAGT